MDLKNMSSDMLADIKKNMSGEIFSLLREEAKDWWKLSKGEDKQFLQELADQIAEERIALETSDNPQRHIENLEFLIVTLEGESFRRMLRLRKRARKSFLKVLRLIIKAIIASCIKMAKKI